MRRRRGLRLAGSACSTADGGVGSGGKEEGGRKGRGEGERERLGERDVWEEKEGRV